MASLFISGTSSWGVRPMTAGRRRLPQGSFPGNILARIK